MCQTVAAMVEQVTVFGPEFRVRGFRVLTINRLTNLSHDGQSHDELMSVFQDTLSQCGCIGMIMCVHSTRI